MYVSHLVCYDHHSMLITSVLQIKGDDARDMGGILCLTPNRHLSTRHIRKPKKLSLLMNRHDCVLISRSPSLNDHQRLSSPVQRPLSATQKFPVPTTRRTLAERTIWTMIHHLMRHRLAMPQFSNNGNHPDQKMLFFSSSMLSRCQHGRSTALCSTPF